jgi:hypothetical protein
MKKSGTLFLLLTFAVVGIIACVISLYARGFRFDQNKITVNGFLVLKSHPESAEIYLDGEFASLTNSNLPLNPATYNVRVRKEGFFDWEKRITIVPETVTEITAHLFRSAPSLSANTFSGVFSPLPSPDMTKVAYIVPHQTTNPGGDDSGLWLMETVNLPLGFNREPRQITDGNLDGTDFFWSPNGREILLLTDAGAYLLDTSKFTPQSQKVNVAYRLNEILAGWDDERQKKLDNKLKKLPDELGSILKRRSSSVMFSPDEKLVLYTASGSARLAESYKKPLPGSSSQKQGRELLDKHTYVYDIEEDKNFLIDDLDGLLTIEGGNSGNFTRRISWLATSRHLILAEEDKIIIMDYDGTNRQQIYAGSYVPPHGYPTVNIDRILILTNLGAGDVFPNIYTLSLK